MSIDRLIGYDNSDSERKKLTIKVSDGSQLIPGSIVKTDAEGKLPASVLPSSSGISADDAFITALIFGG